MMVSSFVFYLLLLILCISLPIIYGNEWNCANTTNTGTFIKSNDCTISGDNHVEVSGTLEIEGSRADMKHLITITAASKHRHFYLNNANAKLILRYLKLVGGDVSSYSSDPDRDGGSIIIYRNGGELNLYSSIVFNNKAWAGGGIYARGASKTNKNAIMNIYNSIIHNNEATYSGGIYIGRAVATIDNTTIDNNQASAYGGGMYIYNSDVTMKNPIISNNDAADRGGGLYIGGDGTTVTLRQSSFINNDATNDGDEIYTYQSPNISLINTYFNNTNNNNNIYEQDGGTPTWKTCSDNLCTETPFTGTCNKANNNNKKVGVICPCTSPNTYVTMGVNATCKIYTNCVAGQYISTKRTAANDRKCKECSHGKFSTNKNQKICAPMITCHAGYYISTKGTSTTDRKCKICDIPGTGTLENQTNAIKCDDCPIGRFNNNHKGICKQCPPGQFAKEKKSKQCVKCPGNPPCAGRGDCDNKIGTCINCKDGWTGKACDVCDSVKWSTKNGLCNKCNDANGFTKRDGICKVKIYLLVLRYFGVISGFLGACALLYKFYIFIKLKRNGKLRKDLGFLKGFLAVIAYGGKGDHIIVSNDDINNTMEENLLGEEERISDDDDMLEMPTVRESFSEILNTAGLSKYKSKFAKHGIQSTSHLDDIVEEDLEELGLSGFQRRQFKKAVTNVKKKKKIQQNDDNNSTMTNDDIVGNNDGNNNDNNNDEESSSKNVMKKKKNDEQKDKKTTPKDTEINK